MFAFIHIGDDNIGKRVLNITAFLMCVFMAH